MMSQHNRRLGAAGEDVAKTYLEKQGMEFIAENFRTPEGEIDLIFREGAVIHFVEVKTRSGFSQGYPEEAVTGTKAERMVAVAETYLQEHFADADIAWQIDVVAVRMKDGTMQLEWIQDALGDD